MIVLLSSLRGSPGVTSWSLVLAAAWPSEAERVVLEADGDGGALAVRCGLGVDPGVAALVAATRRHDVHVGEFEIESIARRLGDKVWVIPGPESAERASSVWGSSVDDVAAMAARDGRVWIVDAGRLSMGALSVPFAEQADFALVLSRADRRTSSPFRPGCSRCRQWAPRPSVSWSSGGRATPWTSCGPSSEPGWSGWYEPGGTWRSRLR